MSSTDDDLKIQNLTKLYTLVLLKINSTITGYQILKRLEREIGRTASPTYIYEFLDVLKKNNIIEDVKTPKSKRSKGFTLTNTGKNFVDKILTRFDNLIDAGVQAKLKICASCGVRLYEDYHSEIIDGKEMYFCCIHCAKSYIEQDSDKNREDKHKH